MFREFARFLKKVAEFCERTPSSAENTVFSDFPRIPKFVVEIVKRNEIGRMKLQVKYIDISI